MDIKTLTNTVPQTRLELFKKIDESLKIIDDEASELRLDQQAEIAALNKKLDMSGQGSQRKGVMLNLLSEKAEMIKPVLTSILKSYGDELSADHVRKIEDFLDFSLPAEDAETQDEKMFAAMDMNQLKQFFTDGMDAAARAAAAAAAAAGAAGRGVADALPDSGDADEPFEVPMGEGEFPFNDEIDLSHEIEHWGAPVKPECHNLVSLARDPSNPEKLVPTGYKFNIKYKSLPESQKPTYHIDLDDELQPTIIRFHAGQPYQDLAYHISSKAWYMNPELGFVNKTEDDVFQLHFNLKKK